MKYMFCNCSSLKKLDLPNFTANKVHDISGMFKGCNSLEELDISNFKIKRNQKLIAPYVFSGCNSLDDSIKIIKRED